MQKPERPSLDGIAERVNQALGIGHDRQQQGRPCLFGSVTAQRDVIILMQPVKLQELFAAREP